MRLKCLWQLKLSVLDHVEIQRGRFMRKLLFTVAGASIGLSPIAANVAQARFLQVDPVGYEDQVNLYTYVGNDPVNKGDPTGKAQCASAQFCEQIETYRQAMITARDTYKSGSDEFGRINASIENIGEVGKGPIAIDGGRNENPTVPANMDRGVLTVYTATMKDLSRDLGVNPTNHAAAIIAHEVDTGHMQPMNSLQDRVNVEISGYTTQEAVQRALDVKTGVNHPANGADRQTRIMNGAMGSVRTSCAGSDHPSCK